MPNKIVPVLYVSDAHKSLEWYSRIGFTCESKHQFAENMPVYAFLFNGENQLHLSEHKGDATPNTLVYFYVDDIDSLANEFGETVKEQPWGTREIWLEDPDGNRWRIGSRG